MLEHTHTHTHTHTSIFIYIYILCIDRLYIFLYKYIVICVPSLVEIAPGVKYRCNCDINIQFRANLDK
jgi:hypothetical protein